MPDDAWLQQQLAIKRKKMEPVQDVWPGSDLPEMDPLVSAIDAFRNRHPSVGGMIPSGQTVDTGIKLLHDAFIGQQEPKSYGSYDNPAARESVRAKNLPGVRYPSDPNQTSRPRQQMTPSVASPMSKSKNKMTIKKTSKPNPASPGDNLTDWIISIEK